MRVLGFGPFVGDFESEITAFRPYVKWVSEVTNAEDTFLFTHSNRAFIYDWISEDRLFPMYHHISRDELDQVGYQHNHVKHRDFNLMIKIFKDEIVKITGLNKKEVELHHLSYLKNPTYEPVHEKSFHRIVIPDINIQEEYINSVVFIPHGVTNEGRASELYDFLRKNYDAIVVGNLSVNLTWDNVVLNHLDYFENGYKTIFKILSEAKLIVCPTSFWTFICNLQGWPVFSYGPSPGPYREDGIYHFDNKNSMIMAADDDTPAISVIRMLEHFMRKLWQN